MHCVIHWSLLTTIRRNDTSSLLMDLDWRLVDLLSGIPSGVRGIVINSWHKLWNIGCLLNALIVRETCRCDCTLLNLLSLWPHWCCCATHSRLGVVLILWWVCLSKIFTYGLVIFTVLVANFRRIACCFLPRWSHSWRRFFIDGFKL